jgi:hypothetical protein
MRPSRSGWSGRRRRQAAHSGRGNGLALSCNRGAKQSSGPEACGPNSQARTRRNLAALASATMVAMWCLLDSGAKNIFVQ